MGTRCRLQVIGYTVVVMMGLALRVEGAPCTATSGEELRDILYQMDDGMGGTTGNCVNDAGRHEIKLSGTIEIDAPLLVDLGNPVDMHGPAVLKASAGFTECPFRWCSGCAIRISKWDHYLHDLTLEDFPTGGICVSGSGHLIAHTTIKEVSGDGIRVTSEGNNIVWNTISGTLGDGIALYQPGTAMQNTVEKYNHYGIALYDPTTAPAVASAILASNVIYPGTSEGRCSNWEPCEVAKPPVVLPALTFDNEFQAVEHEVSKPVAIEFKLPPASSADMGKDALTEEGVPPDEVDAGPAGSAAGCSLLRTEKSLATFPG